MKSSPTIAAISAALIKAQRNMGQAVKDAKNPFFNSKYADYGAVLEVVKDPLNEQGIAILQPTWSDEHGSYVETVLVHESGEFISSSPLKLVLSKNDMQALGSAITYGRRYTLQSLLGIPAEDDDGNGATGKTKTANATRPKEPTATVTAQPPKSTAAIKPTVNGAANSKHTGGISDAQRKRLFAITKEHGWSDADLRELLKNEYKIESTNDIWREDYDSICKYIQAHSMAQVK